MKELAGSRGYGSPCTVRRRLVEMYEMLHLAPWDKMALSISYTSEEFHNWGRDLGIYYRWTENKECNTRTLDFWKELARKQDAAVLEGEAARLQLTARVLEDIGGRVEHLRACVVADDASAPAVWGAPPPSPSSPPGHKRQRLESPTSPTMVLAAAVTGDGTPTASPLPNKVQSMVRKVYHVPVSAQSNLGNSYGTSGSLEGSTGSMAVQRRGPGEDLSENGGAGGDTGVPARHQLLWPDKLLDVMLCMRFTDPTIAPTIERATSEGLKMAAWQHIATRVSGMAGMRFSERQVRAKFVEVEWEYKHWSEAGYSEEERRAMGRPSSYMSILRRWFGSKTLVARPQ
jgi:hypothetical protein